jgi:hypothetical protein
MLIILYVMVGGTMMLVLVVLAVVVVGIKQEPSAKELPSQAPNALTAWVRRLLGVYVRKPDQPSTKIAANPGSPHGIRPAGQQGMRNESCRKSFHGADLTLNPASSGPGEVPRPAPDDPRAKRR